MIPLFSTEQIRLADKYAIEKLGIASIILMENAAISIYHAILNELKSLTVDDKIGIITGKGNNGGDGFAVARHFLNNGFNVTIFALADEKELKGDALTNFNTFKMLCKQTGKGRIIVFKNLSELNKLNDCLVIVDAILGTGTQGNIREPYASILKRVNAIEAFKVAIDIPSGLNADQGNGEIVFNADFTVSLAEMKKGLFFGEGYKSAGKIVKGSIGLGSEFFDKLEVKEYCIEPEDAFFALPEKHLAAQKYSTGKVLVIAGSGKLPGAAVFTTNSALKVGAGAVTLAFPSSIRELAHSKLDSATLIAYDDKGKEYFCVENLSEISEKINWADVISIGPGLGREETTQKAVLSMLNKYKNKSFVLDADAIYALGGGRYKVTPLKNCILTPHHKEFCDMLEIDLTTLQNNLLFWGRKFVGETKSYLVLKGAPSIIFTPDGDAMINSAGNPGMAKFGTGDVLTGVISGLLAQNGKIEESLIAGVYLHSLAGDLLLEEKTVYGYTATDLMNNLPTAMKFIIDSIIS